MIRFNLDIIKLHFEITDLNLSYNVILFEYLKLLTNIIQIHNIHILLYVKRIPIYETNIFS